MGDAKVQLLADFYKFVQEIFRSISNIKTENHREDMVIYLSGKNNFSEPVARCNFGHISVGLC